MVRASFISRLVLAILALIIFSACDVFKSPTGPTGFDPSKPVGPGNMPPGPGSSVRAQIQSWGVYLGDCPQNPAECERELRPTTDPALKHPPPPWLVDEFHSFVLKSRKYTAHMCVTHPRVQGRRMSIRLAGPTSEQSISVVFDEGERPSPFCQGLSFEMTWGGGILLNGIGELRMNEDNQDLFEPTTRRIGLGLRWFPDSHPD